MQSERVYALFGDHRRNIDLLVHTRHQGTIETVHSIYLKSYGHHFLGFTITGIYYAAGDHAEE